MYDVQGAGGADMALNALEQWIRAHFGISYSAESLPILASRVDSLCAKRKIDVVGLLSRVSTGDRALTLELAEVVSTNHTFFLREPEVFDFFANTICPSLPTGPVRIWSAATSSGDEAYTIAMILRESLVGASRDRVRILGTDISERQVQAAEEAMYPIRQIELLGRERLGRWFTPVGLGQVRVSSQLREMCSFRRMNLTQQPWPFDQRFHVIFLRNVLYYFQPAVRQTVVEACYAAAEPGAWLVTSLTEPMLDLKTRWAQVRPGIYKKEMSR